MVRSMDAIRLGTRVNASELAAVDSERIAGSPAWLGRVRDLGKLSDIVFTA